MNFKAIRYVLSKIFLAIGCFLVVPLIIAAIYKESFISYVAFGSCAIGAIGLSFLLGMKIKDKNLELGAKEGLVTVALAWLALSVYGALPYVIGGAIPNYFDALFETVSGFTTTGSSIITDLSVIPHSFLFYRAMTQWIGGIGILVFILTILTEKQEKSSIHLLRAESTGPNVGKLTSKMKITTRILYTTYVVLTLLEIILLWCSPEIDLYTAICISFATTATGGFGILGTSIATYSIYAQYVIAVVMFLAGVNFTIYYLLILGKFKQIFKNEELRAYSITVVLAVIFICINTFKLYSTFEETFRNAFFTVSSIITTTGFAIGDFLTWPTFSKVILFILMLFGACAGSTAGGIKMSRILIVNKSAINKIKQKTSPNSISVVKLDNSPVETSIVSEVESFVYIYVALMFIFTLLLSFEKGPQFDFATNLTASLTCISNVGPGLTDLIGPLGNFAQYSWFSKVLLSLEMLIGRLELFPILAIFNIRTWKKY